MPRTDAAATIESLRARIWALERRAPAAAETLALAPEIDAALPWGGLPLACLHEIVAADQAAATGFVAVVLGRLSARGPVLWCLPRGAAQDLYPPGLTSFGLAAERLIVVRGRDRTELLWAMEEGLRCPRLGGVVAEIPELDLTAQRRLQLAAEAGGTTGFALQPPTARPAGAATTRWRVAAAVSAATAWGGIGAPRWRLALERCRGGAPRDWLVEWRAGELVSR